jgi:hypothetical protein
MNILKIFYENIVKEATSGRIDCLFYYNIVFNTKIVEDNKEYLSNIDNDNLLIPTLIIRDKKLFDQLLIEYVNAAMEFYDNYNFDRDILDYQFYDEDKKICKEKVILALLFANATIDDFNNPTEYIKRRIDFICNDISGKYDLGYCNMFKGNVLMEIEPDIINNETPYQMVIKTVSSNGEEFVLPRIKLGVSGDSAYIYAIQTKTNENNSFCKKINRVLYKIGEGYNYEYEEDGENLKDITSSFLVALNICTSYLRNLGYNKIIVPTFLIERWNAKSISNLLKIKYKKLDDDMANEIISGQDILQANLTNKLVRTFLRLGCHYNNIDVLSFPYEIDSCLHMILNNNELECNNSLLKETYLLMENAMINIHYKK